MYYYYGFSPGAPIREFYNDSAFQGYCYPETGVDRGFMRRPYVTASSLKFSIYAPASVYDCRYARRFNDDFLGRRCGKLSYLSPVALYFDDPGNMGTIVDIQALGTAAIPEPSLWSLLVAGFAFTGFAARQGRRATATGPTG